MYGKISHNTENEWKSQGILLHSTEHIFQDLQWMPETTDVPNLKYKLYNTYIPMT